MSEIFELPPGYGADVYCTPALERLRAQPNAEIDLTIFMSCYNEQDLIVGSIEMVSTALRDLGRLTFEIIVVDDCSSDGSVALVKDYIASHPDAMVMLRSNRKNRGLSQNYVDTAFIGIGRYYRLVTGDIAEPIEQMKIVYGTVGSADMIIPYYPNAVAGKNFIRMRISGSYVGLINLLAGQKIHYYNGLPIHRRFNVMRWHPTTRGFGFQADIICMLLEQGYTYKEVPVLIGERNQGNSNALTISNFLSVAHTVLNLIIRRLARRFHEGNAKRRKNASRAAKE